MLEIDLLWIYDRAKTETMDSRFDHHAYVWILLFNNMSDRVDDKDKVMTACCYCRLYHGLTISHGGKWDIKELRRKKGIDPSRHVLS